MSGQVTSGTITVVAEDATMAVVPNASVTVLNKNTGLARSGQTGGQGDFLAPFLPAGEYTISVQAQGFKRSTIAQFTLQVDQSATVRVLLTPGDLVETVEVTESTPLLEADTSSLGQVIENKKILDLPLNGRNPFALGLLAGNTTNARCTQFTGSRFPAGVLEFLAAGQGILPLLADTTDAITRND